MRILISNDDGVLAPALKILVQMLSDIAIIDVVVPDRNRSGASNSLTLDNPLRLSQLENGFYSVEGTPTDCIHLAMTGLFETKPDLVISGVNHGANLGDDVFYSGTVAAAIEARLFGISALAVSLAFVGGDKVFHYETAAQITRNFALQYAKEPLSGAILNINIPNAPFHEIRGHEITRLGRRHIAEPMVKSQDPRGRDIYWVGPAEPESDAGVGTDFNAVNNGNISITPLQLDLTHYQIFDEVAVWAKCLKL